MPNSDDTVRPCGLWGRSGYAGAESYRPCRTRQNVLTYIFLWCFYDLILHLQGCRRSPDGARSVVWAVCVLQLCSETELLGCVGWGFRC